MSKVASTRIVYLSGIINGEIKQLPTICVRKNCIRNKKVDGAKKIISRKYDVLGIISHPGIHKSATANYVNAWCHPYRNPSDFLDQNKPSILLSESDFVDPLYIEISEKQQLKWDYFYFTMGGEKMGRRKGFDVFLSILPFLHKANLKGIVINYSGAKLHFNGNQDEVWNSCSDNIKYYHKKFSASKVASIMEKCRFGLFPNKSDCSPLLLTESIVRNKPVLVNEEIVGGWKYVNDQTGCFFSVNRLSEFDSAIDKILSSEFHPRDNFMLQYGFEKTSKRLSDFGNEHLKSFTGCSMSCFEGLSHILQKFIEI